jgi:hypothetical protein
MTVREYIEAYVGEIGAIYTIADRLLPTSIVTVIDRLIAMKPAMVNEFSEHTFSLVSPINVTKHVSTITTQTGVRSIEIKPTQYRQVLDRESIHYATKNSPKHFIRNNELYIYPRGVGVQYSDVCYPTLTTATEEPESSIKREYLTPILLHTAYSLTPEISRRLFSEISVESLESLSLDLFDPDSPYFVEWPTEVTLPSAEDFFTYNGDSFASIGFDVTADLATLKEYVETDEDVEMVQAKIQEITTKIGATTQKLQTEMTKYMARVQEFGAANQEFQSALGKYTTLIQAKTGQFAQVTQKVVQEITMQLQVAQLKYGQIQATAQMLKSEYNESFAPYATGEKQ